jgi:protein-tyrosine-phosphatase
LTVADASATIVAEAVTEMLDPVTRHHVESAAEALQGEFAVTKQRPEVLFVCVQNAGRSQMAAGLLSLRSRGRVGVRSAGSDPAESVNPLAVKAMAELGVDLGEAFPKPLTDELVRAADVVVTMSCGDACPIYPGKRYEDWRVADPAEASSLDEVRSIRDDIDELVQRLLAELDVPATN